MTTLRVNSCPKALFRYRTGYKASTQPNPCQGTIGRRLPIESLSHVPLPTLTTTPVRPSPELSIRKEESNQRENTAFFPKRRGKKKTPAFTHRELGDIKRFTFICSRCTGMILRKTFCQHSLVSIADINPALRYVKTEEVILIKSQSVLSLQAQQFLNKLKINLTSTFISIVSPH